MQQPTGVRRGVDLDDRRRSTAPTPDQMRLRTLPWGKSADIAETKHLDHDQFMTGGLGADARKSSSET
jgi:hypothetical protein